MIIYDGLKQLICNLAAQMLRRKIERLLFPRQKN